MIHTLFTAYNSWPQWWFTHCLRPKKADHNGDSHLTSVRCRLQRDFAHWLAPCVKSTALQQQSHKDTAQGSCHGSSTKSDASGQQNKAAEEQVELVTGQVRAQVVNKGMDLTQPKHSQCLQNTSSYLTQPKHSQCLQNTPSYRTQHTVPVPAKHTFISDTAQTHLHIWHSPKHTLISDIAQICLHIWHSPNTPSYLTLSKHTFVHLHICPCQDWACYSRITLSYVRKERANYSQITLSNIRTEQVTHRQHYPVRKEQVTHR